MSQGSSGVDVTLSMSHSDTHSEGSGLPGCGASAAPAVSWPDGPGPHPALAGQCVVAVIYSQGSRPWDIAGTSWPLRAQKAPGLALAPGQPGPGSLRGLLCDFLICQT